MLNKEELDNLLLLLEHSTDLGLTIFNNPDIYDTLTNEQFNEVYLLIRNIPYVTRGLYHVYDPKVWSTVGFRKLMLEKMSKHERLL